MSTKIRRDFHRAVSTNINTYIKTILELAKNKDLIKAHALAPDILINGRSIPQIILDDLMDAFILVMQNVEMSEIPLSFYKQLMVARHGAGIGDSTARKHLTESLEKKRKILPGQTFVSMPEFPMLLNNGVPENIAKPLMTIWRNCVTSFGQLLYSEAAVNSDLTSKALLNHVNKVEADLKATDDTRQAALDILNGKNKNNNSDKEDTPKARPEAEGDGVVVHYAEDIKDVDATMAGLIGLSEPKKQVQEIRARVRYKKALLDTGLLHGDKPSMDHYVFRGPPGTGKTTFGRLIGKIYKDAGLLESGHVVECSRVSLVGGYIGQSEIKTQKAIESAMGGVLFVDEAYSLFGTDNDFGPKALEVILRAMEVHKDKLIVVFAGYPDKMDGLIQSNPGLTRRFKNTVNFNDFKMDELIKIFDINLKSRQMSITPQARDHVEKTLQKIKTMKGPDFGNAGTVENIVEMLRDKLALATEADGTLDKIVNLLDMEQEIPTAIKTRLTQITLEEARQILPENEVSHKKPSIGFTPN